jgi:integrase
MARPRYQKGSLRKKNGVWTLRFREHFQDSQGKLKTISRTRILLPGSRTKTEARRMADQLMAERGFGAEQPRTMLTFAELWDQHFTPNVIPNLKPSTQQLYRALGKVHLIPAFGAELVAEITRLDVQQFINSKRLAGYSVQTLTHLKNLLSKVLGSAVRWNLAVSNPAREIELPPMVRKRTPRVLTPEEISALRANIREPARTVFLCGILMGLRIGEILALQAGDIDLLKSRIYIRRDVYRGHVGTPKTAASARVLPLPDAALPLLAFHCQGKKPDDWLFPSAAGSPLHDRNLLRREIRPVCDKLEMQRFGWHSLRHTFSTYGGNSGVAMPVLQSLLGHTSADMTMRYTHPLEGAQRQAIEGLALQLWPNVAHGGSSFANSQTASN